MHARHLATAAGLALAATVVAAAPTPLSPTPTQPGARPAVARPALPAGQAEVPVVHGSARFRMPSATLARLKARGVRITPLGAKGKRGEDTPYGHTGRGMTLRIERGAVTKSGGKVGGELRFRRAGLALTRHGTKRTVKLTRWEIDLSQGTLRAGLGAGTALTLGRFTRPALRSALNVRTGVLRMNLAIALTPVAAAKLNAALGASCFVGDRPLLRARIVASLDPSVHLRTALNLG